MVLDTTGLIAKARQAPTDDWRSNQTQLQAETLLQTGERDIHYGMVMLPEIGVPVGTGSLVARNWMMIQIPQRT